MKNIGILLDPATGDLQLRNGSVALGDVTRQNQAFIIGHHAGSYRLAPTLGVGISDAVLDDADLLQWQTEIERQLRNDGQTVQKVVLTNQTLDINAHY